jgi:ParB family chromosome partitioning protein
MFRGKGGLGRGLDALLPSSGAGFQEVDVDLIVPNPQQPRSFIDPEQLAELTESIREHGILQPLVVSRMATQGGAITYQLIAGERRLQAAKQAGLEKVPVLVKEATPQELLELALVENVQRADLSPLEEAQAYRRLMDEFGLTQESVATRVGKSRVTVANSLRLLGLSPEIKASLARGQITEGHARALLGIGDEQVRHLAWQRVCDEGLSVRDTEELVRQWREQAERQTEDETKRRAQTVRDPWIAALEEKLRSVLSTKVQLKKGGRKGGRLTIYFYSDEEMESVIDTLLRRGARP